MAFFEGKPVLAKKSHFDRLGLGTGFGSGEGLDNVGHI